MTDVFISYSRRDLEFGKRLHARLTETDYDIWMDWEDIPPTADWWGEIREGIEEADNFVLIMSPDSIGSPVCQMEILTAIENGKRIIPLFYRDPEHEKAFQASAARVANDKIVQQLLGNRDPLKLAQDNWQRLGFLNWVFFNDEHDFDEKFAQLIDIINTDLEHAKAHTRLLTRALEWEKSGRANAPLLSGSQIQEAETWLSQATSKSPQPTPLQSEYISASRAYQQKQQRRLLMGVSVALLVSIGMTIFAGFQFQLAQTRAVDAERANNAAQIANELALTAESNLETQNAVVVQAIQTNAFAATQDASLSNLVNDLLPIAVVQSDVQLRVRDAPAGDVVRVVSSEDRLRVLGFAQGGESIEGVWLAVQLPDDTVGYLASDFVVVPDILSQDDFNVLFATETVSWVEATSAPQTTNVPAATATSILADTQNYGSGFVSSGGTVNVRSGTSLAFNVVSALGSGEQITIVSIVETVDEGGWIEVLLPDGVTTGFVPSSVVVITGYPSDYVTPTLLPTATPDSVVSDRQSRGIALTLVRIRTQPDISSTAIGMLAEGQEVTVIRVIESSPYNWVEIRLDGGATGFVVSDFIEISDRPAR